MKLLIVGNGSIGVHKNTRFYINNHTGSFLKAIAKYMTVTFTQGITVYNKDNNLQNFDLKKEGLAFKVLPKIKNLTFLRSAYKVIKEHEFLYLFYPGTSSQVIAIMAIILNKPYGLYIRGQYYNQHTLDSIILKKAQFILTVSPALKKDILRFCKRVDVIKPMIDIQKTDFNVDRDYKIPVKWHLLFVGRVEERKGIHELIAIAKYLKKEGINFILDIVGGGELYEILSLEIKNQNLDHLIVLHGLISKKKELKKMYDKANTFVFTSHDEGFPRVLYEAMASGLPIFTTFVGGIPGRMEHLKNCIEIPVRNADKAGSTIFKYLKEEKVLEEIGKNGQKTLSNILCGTLLSHEQLLLNYMEDEKII